MRILHTEASWDAMEAANELEAQGLYVTRVNDGRELLDFAEHGEQCAVVFETNLPDIGSESLTRALRHFHPKMPLYALAHKTDWSAHQSLFESGVDDVLSPRECPKMRAAQIRSAVARVAGFASPQLRYGALEIDMGRNSASIHGCPLHITRKEYEILEMLILQQNRLISRDDFMNHLYAWDEEPNEKIINVYLSRIRQQIADCGGDPKTLETVWGMGFRLNSEAA